MKQGFGALVLALSILPLACGGPKKRAVTRQDFQAVTDYVDRNMRSGEVTPAERKKYTLSQLGAPHHVEGDSQLWYSSAADCYYLQLGEDGWASWGSAPPRTARAGRSSRRASRRSARACDHASKRAEDVSPSRTLVHRGEQRLRVLALALHEVCARPQVLAHDVGVDLGVKLHRPHARPHAKCGHGIEHGGAQNLGVRGQHGDPSRRASRSRRRCAATPRTEDRRRAAAAARCRSPDRAGSSAPRPRAPGRSSGARSRCPGAHTPAWSIPRTSSSARSIQGARSVTLELEPVMTNASASPGREEAPSSARRGRPRSPPTRLPFARGSSGRSPPSARRWLAGCSRRRESSGAWPSSVASYHRLARLPRRVGAWESPRCGVRAGLARVASR